MGIDNDLCRLVKLKWQARKNSAPKSVIDGIQKKISEETERVLDHADLLNLQLKVKKNKSRPVLKIIKYL